MAQVASGSKTVDRVVLDTNYFRTITEEEARALRARGLKISLATVAVAEALRAAKSDRKLGLARAPLKRLLPLLDRYHPVLPGVDILGWQFGSASVATLRRRQQIVQGRGRVLAQTLRDQLRRDTLRPAGPLVLDKLDEQACGWLALREEIRQGAEALPPEARKLPKEALVAELREAFRSRIPFAQTFRFDAYFAVTASVAADELLGAARRKAKHNDGADLSLVTLVGVPAILATADRRLIEEVDRSGTYQAPWVRTLGELLTDPLPKGLPWGPSVQEASSAFRRRSRAELDALERAVRRRNP